MNLIVVGCPGIGKTTISSRNNLFVDIKKAKIIKENNFFKEYESKILLMNFVGIDFLKSKIDKDDYKILILNINTKIASILKKRLIKRETQKIFSVLKVLNEINAIDKFSSLNYEKDKDVIIKRINNEKELNNLENILLEEYNKLNVEDGRYNKS